VIGALENYQADFTPAQVVPTTIVLLNLLPDLPVREAGMFDFSTSLVVTRVTYRLLRSLGDPARIEAAAREIIPNLTTLTSKSELITDLGYRENQGHKMVSESAAAEFERAWRDEVRASPLDRLLREKELLRVLLVAKRDSGPSESPIVIAQDPALTLALLKGARQEVKSQTLGNRAVSRSARLEWDVLVDLYGSEDVLKQRIAELKSTPPQGVDDLLALAEKYASGWRPERESARGQR